METEHTPTPWSTVHGRLKHKEAMFIKSSNVFVGKVYGHEEQPVEANAAFIVKACNAHEDLVDTVIDFLVAAETGVDVSCDLIDAARALLARIDGEAVRND